jgi:hypothetical protein
MSTNPPKERWFADAVPVRAAMIDAYFERLDDIERVLAFRVLRETRVPGKTAAPFPTEALAKPWRSVGRYVSAEEIRAVLARLVAKGVILEVRPPLGNEGLGGPHYCTNDAWPDCP